eukprot:s2984_g2.t1
MNVLDDDCSTSDGENILVIDGESGDAMMERPTQQGTKKVNKTKRRKKKKKVHEVAVGSEEDYEGHVEELDDDYEGHVEELDDVEDDDDVYPPSFAGDAPDIEHGVEVDEEEAGEDDDEDVIDVDEEDGEPRRTAYNAGKPIPKLKTPHYTERVELREPLEFPCKENYEKINVTIEGLKEKDRLEGSPDYLPLPPPGTGDDDNDDDQGDDNAGDEDKGDGGGDGPDGGSKSGVDPSIMAEVEELELQRDVLIYHHHRALNSQLLIHHQSLTE